MNLAPNILLTNFCNAKCSYCFARDEMSKDIAGEMEFKKFLKLVTFLKKNKIISLRLMGGEPTLHSQFEKVIKVGIKEFEEVVVFTNGLMPPRSKQILLSESQKLIFNFNLDTTELLSSNELKKRVMQTVIDFLDISKVSVGLTVSSFSRDYSEIFTGFKKNQMKRMGVRMGYAKTIVGRKPIFIYKDQKKLGKKMIEVVNQLIGLGFKDIYVDCGMEKSMFSQQDLSWFIKKVKLNDWGCRGKWSSFDVATDLTVFPCFPHYQTNRYKLDKFKTLEELSKKVNQKKSCYK